MTTNNNAYQYVISDTDDHTIIDAGGGAYGNSASNWTFSDITPATTAVNIDTSGINMTDGTDIKIGGRSMREFMESVEKRLAILEPNHKLESEWAELKELGERYRAMEQGLIEKAKVWGILKD